MDELREEQREVFLAHESDGRSFKEMAAKTGVSVNRLLSRKHYAVLHLRRRLQAIYDEITKTRGSEHERREFENLSWILFGGLRGGPGRYGRRRFRESWEEMTPEQREKVRAGI